MRLITLCVSLMLSFSASATSMVMTTDMIGSALTDMVASSSDGTSSTFGGGDEKVIIAAKDDSAAFVASHGEIVGVRLEAAFKHIREATDKPWNDMDLAKAILIY